MGAFDDLVGPAPAPTGGLFDDIVPPARSAIGEIAAGLKRGVYQGLVGGGRELQAPAEIANQPPGILSKAGSMMVSAGQAGLAQPDLQLQPQVHNAITNALAGPVSQFVGGSIPVATGMVATGAAGAAAGSVVPVLGTALGGTIGSVVGGAASQGLQSYGEKYAEHLAQHPGDVEGARAAASGSGAIGAAEGGAYGVLGPAAKFARPAASALEAGLGVVAPKLLPAIGRQIGVNVGGAVGINAAGAAAQAKLDENAGTPTPTPLEAAKASVLPSAGMGALFSVVGLLQHTLPTQLAAARDARALADPMAPKADRESAANKVAAAMGQVSPEAASTWMGNAKQAMRDGKPIDVTEDWTQHVPQELRPTVRAGVAGLLAGPDAYRQSQLDAIRQANAASAEATAQATSARPQQPPAEEAAAAAQPTIVPTTGGGTPPSMGSTGAENSPSAPVPAVAPEPAQKMPPIAPNFPGGQTRAPPTDPLHAPDAGPISQAAAMAVDSGLAKDPYTPQAPEAPAPLPKVAMPPDLAMQNRDRSRPGSVAQMDAIANNPDYDRLGVGKSPNEAAPLVSVAANDPDAIRPQDFGKTSKVVLADNSKMPFRYAVVDAPDVLASHNADGSVNGDYFSGSVPPGTIRALNNGRVAGIQAAWERGTADPYKAAMIADAESHGVSPEAIESKANPMLVRVYDDAENTRANMGALSNPQSALKQSAPEQAQNDARMLDVGALNVGDDGNVMSAANAPVLRQFLQGIPIDERNDLTGPDGRYTKQFGDRVQAALFAKAYGDPNLVSLATESADPEIANVLKALTVAAPEFAKVEPGNPMDIRGSLIEATNLMREAKSRGIKPIEMAQQQDLLGRDPFTQMLFGLMAKNTRSAPRMAVAFTEAARFVQNEAAAGTSGDMFGRQRATPADLANRINSHLEAIYGPGAETKIRAAEGGQAYEPTQRAPEARGAANAAPAPDGGEPGQVEGAAPATPGRLVKPFVYEPAAEKKVTPEERAIETRFGADLERHPALIRARYARIKDSEGGKVLNTDAARELSPDYLKDRTQSNAVHEVASAVIRRLYKQMLAEKPKEGELPLVMFTAGGTGAGKTTSINRVREAAVVKDAAQIVYDTNMNTLKSARQKIDQALAAEKDVFVLFTYRDPVDAWKNGAIKRAKSQAAKYGPGNGRTIAIATHLETHAGSLKVIRELAAHYKGDDRVRFAVLDNSRGPDGAEASSIEKLPEKLDNDVESKLHEILETERENGLHPALYQGFLGRVAGEQGAAGSVRETNRAARAGQPAREEQAAHVVRPFALTGETPTEIRAANALEAKAERDARLRAAAPSEKGFRLAGSDREDDIATAHGQMALGVQEPRHAPTQGELDLFKRIDEETAKAVARLPVRSDNNAKAQTARARALRDLTQGGRLSILAASINLDMILDGTASLMGRRVTGMHDVAALGQIFRDPRFETMRYIMTKNGIVVHESALSSRLPSLTVAYAGHWPKFVMDMRDIAKRVKADALYVQHNHPSGNPEPSSGDVWLTTMIRQTIGTAVPLKGHVVIDTDSYGVITPLGVQSVVKYNFGGVAPHRFDGGVLGARVDSIEDIASLMSVSLKANHVAMIGTDARGHVVAMAELPHSAISRSLRSKAIISRFARASGSGGGVYLSGVPKALLEEAEMLVSDGLLRDVLMDNGVSARARLEHFKIPIRDSAYLGHKEGAARLMFRAGETVVPYRPGDLFGDAPQVTLAALKRIKAVSPAMGDLFEQASAAVDKGGAEADIGRQGKPNESTGAIRRPSQEKPAGKPAGGVSKPGTQRGAGDLFAGTQRPGGEVDLGTQGRPDEGRPGSGIGAPSGGERPDTGTGIVPKPGGRPVPGPRKRPAAWAAPERPGVNYRITAHADALGAGSPRQHYENNVAAIKLVKQLAAEDRLATAAEQEILAKFNGWGALKNAFFLGNYDDIRDGLEDPSSWDARRMEEGQAPEWAKQRRELHGLLTKDEYEAASAATLNSHFTAPQVVRGVWDAMTHLGFDKGRILEPALGDGRFFGLMPDTALDSTLTGVELDKLTGAIAHQLYQKADIRVQGFEKAQIPDNYYDVAISNFPFGGFSVDDPAYNRSKLLIHDYFFAKALDRVRPGGIVAAITSDGTMDKRSSLSRQLIAKKGELLGAIRLPNDAFKKNAGTEVTTDLIFLRKRNPGEVGAPDERAWKDVVEVDTQTGKVRINEYYAKHPDLMLGTMGLEGQMYRGGDQALTSDGRNLGEALHQAIQTLPKDLYRPAENIAPEPPVPAPDDLKPGALIVKDGNVFVKTAGMLQAMPGLPAPKISAMLAIRDAARAHLRGQVHGGNFAETAKALNQVYDAFVKKYGALNSAANEAHVLADSDAALLFALEKWNPDTRRATKADLFTKPTVSRLDPVESVDGADAALAVSLNERGGVDLAHMAQISGLAEADLIDHLGGRIFYEPVSRAWQVSDEYLSGNVRTKLADATSAAKADPRFEQNVKALQAVQPEDFPPERIRVRLGQTWIPKDHLNTFANELFNVGRSGYRKVEVHFTPKIGEWRVYAKGVDTSRPEFRELWGTHDVNGVEVLEAALNQTKPQVRFPKDEEGRAAVNKAATLAAGEKVDAVRAEFERWWKAEPARRDEIAGIYNQEENNIRLREFDGSHLTLPGHSPLISLRKNVLDGAWRIVTGGNTLLAHAVGAGKTFTAIAGSQEMKRLGLIRKPMHIVQKHTLDQYAADFQRLYPNSSVLIARNEDMAKEGRKLFTAKVATGNWDAIVMTHPQFERVKMSRDYQRGYIQKQLDELVDAIMEGKQNQDDPRLLKRLEAAKKKMESKLARLLNEPLADDVIDFEQLGVDQIFVDEAHAYKNLYFLTRLRNVSGISSTDTKRSTDIFLKTQYLNQLQNGKRGVVFMTGTPISNSLVEMFTMQRYLGMEALSARNLERFDNWAAQHAEAVTEWEMSPDGGSYRAATRFSRFVNMAALSQMFRTFADIKRPADLHLPVPEVEGGKGQIIESPKTDAMDAYVQTLVKRSERIKNGAVDKSVDNMLKITNDGKLAALDLRLVDPTAEDVPTSKVNKAVDEIYKNWLSSASRNGTQLVFSNLSVPQKGGKFSVYTDIRNKLIKRGIPPAEIAFVQQAKTDEAKEKLFYAVREGRVRVVFGATGNLGTGTNVQDKLFAVHHLDVPWTPAEIEQRNGRIVRQGNEHYDLKIPVKIAHYVTGGSFDAFMWSAVERKDGFIQQALSADSRLQEMEDVGQRALTYAELKAIASGNPLIIEKATVDQKVLDLTGAKSRHEAQVTRLRQQATEAEEHAASEERYAANAEIDEKSLVSTRGDAFQATIGGKQYADRPEAAKALENAIARAPVGETGSVITTPIGKLGGMEIAVGRTNAIKSAVVHIPMTRFVVEGKNTYTADSGDSVDGNLSRLENLVGSIAGTAARARQDALEIRDAGNAAADGAKAVFPKEAELTKMLQRQQEIDKELGVGKDDAQAATDEDAGPPPAEERKSAYRSRARPEANPPPNAKGFRERFRREPPKEEPSAAASAAEKAFGHTLYSGVEPQRGTIRKSLTDALKKLFAPAARGVIGRLQAGIMRANLARMAREGEIANGQFRIYAKAFGKLSRAEQIAFVNRYEREEPQATPALEEASRAMHDFNRELRMRLQALGKLDEFDENYLGRIWRDPEARVNSVFARRPLEGSKAFLKRRVYTYFSDGLEAGLKPITWNPIEMLLLKGVEQRRFIYAQKIGQEMRAAGLVRQMRYGQRPPDGWTAINDKIFSPGSHGPYYAPDQAATIFNNHLSPGLRGNAAYDAFRKAGMLMNSAQLGLSLFHAGFTTLDSMVSKAALGVQQLSRGQFLKGTGNLLQSLNPAQPFLNAYKGDRLLRAYLGELSDPSLAPIVEALVQGGGRVKLDEFYRNAAINGFKQALARNDKLGAAAAFLPTILDRMNAPVFEYLVPRQKLGVFFDLARDWLERNPNAGMEAKRAAMGKMWDSVDNRMGQLAYDNVFWNRTLKDLLMVSVRSVGWNLGTFRELGGGLLDVKDIRANRELSTRSAYVIALPFLTGMVGSIVGYLYTGNGPDELKDYFFPKTGRTRPDRSDDRVSLPSYMKDVYEYGHDIGGFLKYGANPTQTLVNKMHPLISTIAQMLQNEDFYGGAIRSPGDPIVTQLADEAAYLSNQILPFGIRNYEQQAKVKGEQPGIGGYLTSPSMIGITPAPGYVTKSDQQLEAAALGRMKDSLIAKFREELQAGANPGDIARRAFSAGLRLPEVHMVLREGLSATQTSRLPPRRLYPQVAQQ